MWELGKIINMNNKSFNTFFNILIIVLMMDITNIYNNIKITIIIVSYKISIFPILHAFCVQFRPFKSSFNFLLDYMSIYLIDNYRV